MDSNFDKLMTALERDSTGSWRERNGYISDIYEDDPGAPAPDAYTADEKRSRKAMHACVALFIILSIGLSVAGAVFLLFALNWIQYPSFLACGACGVDWAQGYSHNRVSNTRYHPR